MTLATAHMLRVMEQTMFIQSFMFYFSSILCKPKHKPTMLLVCSHPGKRIGRQVLWARATVYMRWRKRDYLRISFISAADEITLFIRNLYKCGVK